MVSPPADPAASARARETRAADQPQVRDDPRARLEAIVARSATDLDGAIRAALERTS
jgi:hypothetical protein